MLLNNSNVLGGGVTANVVGGNGLFADGTAAAPSISFLSDPDTGIYRAAANRMAFAAGGADIAQVSSTSGLFGGAGTTGVFAMPKDPGTVGAPAYSFAGDTDTGMYRTAADTLGFAAGGALIAYLNSTYLIGGGDVSGCFAMPKAAGVVGAPAYSFKDDPDTGMYRAGADNLAFATGGVIGFGITGQVLNVCAGTAVTAGGAAGHLKIGTTSAFGIHFGSGAPTISAAKGSLYLRSDGSGTNDRVYVNTDAGTTWTALVTVA